MKDFQLFFTADNLPYRTTISAKTGGQAQDKFVKWFTQIFKPERGIEGVARITKIVPIEKEDVKVKVKDSFLNCLKFWR